MFTMVYTYGRRRQDGFGAEADGAGPEGRKAGATGGTRPGGPGDPGAVGDTTLSRSQADAAAGRFLVVERGLRGAVDRLAADFDGALAADLAVDFDAALAGAPELWIVAAARSSNAWFRHSA